MDVIHFEATVDGDFQEDTNKADFCVERNDIDFIDDFDVSDNVCDYYRFENVTRLVGNSLEDVFIESNADLENNN